MKKEVKIFFSILSIVVIGLIYQNCAPNTPSVEGSGGSQQCEGASCPITSSELSAPIVTETSPGMVTVKFTGYVVTEASNVDVKVTFKLKTGGTSYSATGTAIWTETKYVFNIKTKNPITKVVGEYTADLKVSLDYSSSYEFLTSRAFSVTANPTPTPSPTASPTATPTVTATPARTTTTAASPTTQATLPEAGTSLPTILGLGAGVTLLIISLLLAL